MKFLIASTLLASLTVLAGCATPPANATMDESLASKNEVFEDKGEMLTGSRIPQKSTAHVLRRVGSAEYKKAKAEANSGSMEPAQWGK